MKRPDGLISARLYDCRFGLDKPTAAARAAHWSVESLTRRPGWGGDWRHIAHLLIDLEQIHGQRVLAHRAPTDRWNINPGVRFSVLSTEAVWGLRAALHGTEGMSGAGTADWRAIAAIEAAGGNIHLRTRRHLVGLICTGSLKFAEAMAIAHNAAQRHNERLMELTHRVGEAEAENPPPAQQGS